MRNNLIIGLITFLVTINKTQAQTIINVSKDNCLISTETFLDSKKKEIDLIFIPIVGDDGKNKAVEIAELKVNETIQTIPTANNLGQIVFSFKNKNSSCNTCKKDNITVKFKDCPNEITFDLETPNGCPQKTNCNCRNFDNRFGEQPEDYNNGKEVILLNFDKNINYRTYYRIYQKRFQRDKLEIEPINFSKYTLWGKKDIEFKIVNVNRFIYDVKFSDSTSKLQSSPSPLFNEFFIGSSSGLMGKLINNYATSYDIMKDPSSPKPEDELIGNLRNFVKKYNHLHDMVTDAYNPCSCFKDCQNVDYLEMANDLLATKLALAALQSKWASQTDTITFKEKLVNDCKKNNIQITSLDKQIDDLEKKQNKTPAEVAQLATLKEERKKVSKCTRDSIPLKLEIANLKKELQPYSALSELQKNLPKEEDLKKMVIFVNNITDVSQTYSSGPIQVSGDELNVTLDIHTNDSVAKVYKLTKFATGVRPFNITVVGRAFGSFSSGIFISPDPNLQNKEYVWQERPNSSGIISGSDSARYVLSESGFSSPPVGFSAYGHIQWMVAKNVGLGISPGVGITIESKPRLAYLLGGSLMLGRERQFIVTAGVAAMQVNVLSNNLKPLLENGTNAVKETPTITYYKELKYGVFLSLSFTPFTVIKSKN